MFDSLKKELTRRTLLHKASFGLMGLSVIGSAGQILQPSRTIAQASPSLPPEKKLGWAVVGLGKFATQQIMPSFAECKQSKLVALVSGDRAKAEKYAQQYGINPKNIYNYQNYDSIRNNPEVDVIYIILPNALHAEYSILEIYSLQATRYITGEEPVEISAIMYSTPNDPRFREIEENVNFTLRFPSGVLANCTSSYGYSDTKRIQVFGTDATLELDPATDYYRHRLTIKRKNGTEEKNIQEKNQFALEIDHLSQSIINNRQPKTPGEEGLQDVRLMQLIYQASRTGKTIKI